MILYLYIDIWNFDHIGDFKTSCICMPAHDFNWSFNGCVVDSDQFMHRANPLRNPGFRPFKLHTSIGIVTDITLYL